ncbi:MAG: RT0821/Lpp0805 family surface protein [Gammaproteobacteria bacterium]
MKNGLITVSLAVTLLLLGGCFTGTKQGIGTATGGALGGFVGSQIGSGSGKLAATAAGAIAGALMGSSVGQSMDDLDRMKAAQALESSRTGYATNWKNPDSGAHYTMTPTRTYESANGPCRDFTTQVDVNGRAETVYGTACRQPDGTWKSVN